MSGLAAFSPRARRLASVGLLALLLAAVFGSLLPQLARWVYRSTEELADARFELARASSVERADKLLSLPGIENAEQALVPWLLAGTTESEAAGRLQETVDGILRGAGLTVESAQAAPTVAAGAVSLVALDWRGSGFEQDAVHAISALEQARPLLRIERVVLRSVDTGGVTAADGSPSRLTVEMRLVGLWIAPPSSGPPTKDGAK